MEWKMPRENFSHDKITALIQARRERGWLVTFLGEGLDVAQQGLQLGTAPAHVAAYAGGLGLRAAGRVMASSNVRYAASLGNVFLGTMLPSYLNAWGARTVLLSGFHLDWCIEQAARSARDLGYNPIVIGDASGCGRQQDDYPTLERINTFFAPVLSARQVASLLQ
jgi:hypothetical protein